MKSIRFRQFDPPAVLELIDVIADTFPLSQAMQAHEMLEAGHTQGKIILAGETC